MIGLPHIVFGLLLVLGAEAHAQARPAATTAAPRARLALEVGGGQLLTLPRPAATVFAADPKIARVQAASPNTLFVAGVSAGRTVAIATAADGAEIATYDVVVGGGVPKPAAGTPSARRRASNSIASA